MSGRLIVAVRRAVFGRRTTGGGILILWLIARVLVLVGNHGHALALPRLPRLHLLIDEECDDTDDDDNNDNDDDGCDGAGRNLLLLLRSAGYFCFPDDEGGCASQGEEVQAQEESLTEHFD